jgi:hemoglobin-like flavoprotein
MNIFKSIYIKMIKGSTKVGEIYVCSQQTNGKLEVQPQFLGKAITGFGGGFDKIFVLEEGKFHT